jgi:hypothetical protein
MISKISRCTLAAVSILIINIIIIIATGSAVPRPKRLISQVSGSPLNGLVFPNMA